MYQEIQNIIYDFQKYSVEIINESIKNSRDIAISQANTEAESSKDYSGRIVYEFFQNAVDRADGNIWMKLTKNTFVISNDGKEFSIFKNRDENGKKSDFYALNTIHDGSKTAGESIGNKGVGFKSCWNVSEHVVIESKKDNTPWGFELFNPVTTDKFDRQDIKKAIENAKGKVPSFYFPKFYKSKEENFKNGAVTKITINLKDDSAYEEIKKELEEFEQSKYFFLNFLENKENKNYQIHISIDGAEKTPIKTKEQQSGWNFIQLDKKNEELFKELSKTREKETYKNIPKNPNIVLAFPPKDEEIDSKFYTYLPTKINCGFNVLIHADFALDNARVSISDNLYNNKILEIAAEMFVDELLNNANLHNREDFARFLLPYDKNTEFAEKVRQALIKDNRLTEILKKVYTKERIFPKQSYETIFEVMHKWEKNKTDRNWGTHYESVYNTSLKYFCNKEIHVVWINENHCTFLPQKKDTNEYKYNLFYKSSDEKNELDYSLLSDVSNLKITSFDSFGNKDVFFHNNIIRKFSTLEIVRALKNKESIDIIKFINQLVIKDDISEDLKKQLIELKLPVKHNAFKPVKQCYFNIDETIKNMFNSEIFFEVDIERLKDIEDLEGFLEKIGVANNRLPFYKEKSNYVLPIIDEHTEFQLTNEFKDFISNSLVYLNDEIIKELKKFEWFYDERKGELYKPSEVFLFKENDNRKIECIAQEKKNNRYNNLYLQFGIKEIDDTTDSEKLITQLENMPEFINTDHHDEIYKKITYQLSKHIEDSKDLDIPILTIQMSDNSLHYIENDEKEETVFLETKYKKYKDQLKDSYGFLACFDNDISKPFLKKINIKKFNPNYEIDYWNENDEDVTPEVDTKLKKDLQEKFLAPFMALASEVLGSNFLKEDAIKRWENLNIKKAPNVVFKIKDNKENIIVESTKASNIDVLYIPLKDRTNKVTEMGEVAHDLQEPMKNPNLRKFAQVFAEGIIRNQKLKSDYELYITGYLNDDNNLCHEILINKGVDNHNLKKMKDFIKENLLSEDEQKDIIKILKRINVNIEDFSQIRDYEKYEKLDLTFKDFEQEFEDKYKSIILSIINGYKDYLKTKIINEIEKNKKHLQILCYMQKNRDYFEKRYEEIKKKQFNKFNDSTNIFNLFDINNKDKDSDEYIEAQIDYKYETDTIPDEKINFELKNNRITAQAVPSLGCAKQSQEEHKQKIQDQLKNQTRGLGQELKIAYYYAKKLYEVNLQDTFIEQLLGNVDFGIKRDNGRLQKYIGEIKSNKSRTKLDFAKTVINIASNDLDGLGYDLLIPEIKDKKIIKILKIELKSTKITDGNIQVYFSDNEIKRIKYFIEKKDDDFRVWLNYSGNDITKEVKEAVKELGSELPFSFDNYILTLGIIK